MRRSLGRGNVEEQMKVLYDEQERVQKKTFTNWINSYLCKHVPPIKVTSLFDDIKDGKVLLALLETLSGDKLPGEKGAKLKRVHYVSNISTALRFLEGKKIKLVNINASDIADGKPSIVLGLIWTIILYFQIEETATRIAEQQAAAAAEGGPKKMTPLERFRVSAKKALMQWTESAIAKRYGLNIKDFGSSWKDGVAFNAIIHNIRPELVDMEKIHQQTPRANLENAFSTAESHLGIARLIDPEDVDVAKPDEKSIMTYVAQFMKAYPDAGEDPALRKSAQPVLTTAEQEQKDLDDLLVWIKEAEEILKIVDQPVQDLQQEYIDYIGFKTNYDIKEEMYNMLGQKINSKRAIKLTEANWKTLQAKFLPVSDNTTRWLQKLDSQLPGRMGELGVWLSEAEQVLRQDPQLIDDPEEMSLQLSQMLQHHKEFFKDAESLKQLMLGVKRAGKYEGRSIYPPHLEDLHKRFTSAYSRAALREKRLEYELHKNQLSSFLSTAEEKLNSWQYKCGRQDDVEAVLADYKEFVHAKKLSATFDKMNAELKKKAEAYKKEISKDKEMTEEVDRYLADVGDKWKSISPDIKNVEQFLVRVIDQWKRYNASVESLTAWIAGGQATLHKSPAEKQAYLKDITGPEEKHRVMNELGTFLVDITEESVASEVKDTVMGTNQDFDDLLANLRQAHQEEVVEKGRRQYTAGIQRLKVWIESTEDLLAQEVPCRHAQLKEYLQLLDNINGEMPQVEADFKATTKTAQSLVQDSSQEEVTQMLDTLNVQKEIIVKLRKEIPDRMKNLKAVLPNVESLETGITDLSVWLDEGETLLDSHKLDGDAPSAEARLEKHKAFFAETTYQKSILESKAKVFQKVMTAKAKLKNIDFSVLEDGMESLQTRFQELLDRGEQSVAQHQEYQDSSNEYVTWLRGAREKLATCSDTFGEKAAILAKIDKVKALSENLSDGSQKLMDATVAGEGAIPNTSAQGQAKIRQELQTMNTDYDEYQEDLAKAQVDLQVCLTKWNDFEDCYDEFNRWLKETEDHLRADLDPKETLEEKKDHLDTYQRYCDDVKAKQAALDTVNEKAQALLKTNADARTSHAITQLTTKYQGVLSLCRDDVKKLEGYHADHHAYKTNLGEFCDWLEEAKVKLRQTNDTSGSKDDVNTRLDHVKDIQAILDHGNTKLRRLLDSSEKTLHNTNPRGCQVIRQETDSMRDEYEKLKSQTSTAKRELEDTLSQWGDFDRAYRQLSDWMMDTESKMKSDPDLKSDLPEKRSSLEKFKAIHNDVTAHKDLMEKLEDRASHMTDPNAKAAIAELKARYETLLGSAKGGVEAMEGQVQGHEDYRKAYNNSVDWLSDAKRKLQRLNDASGDCQSLETRLQALQDFQAEISRGEDIINQTNLLGEELCQSTAPRGQDLVRQELQTLKDDWHTFSVAVGEVEGSLETAITDWKQYEGEQADLNAWLEKTDTQVRMMLSPQADLAHKQQQLMEGQKLYEDIEQQKSVLDEVRADAESVSRRSSDPRVATNVMQLSTKYQTLQSAAKNMMQGLEENVSDHQSYNDAYDDCLQWLDMTHQRLKDCNDTSGDWHTLADKVDLVKEITASMDDGLQRVNRCCDLAEKILPNSAPTGKKAIDQEITKLTQDWEEMNREINAASSILEGVQSKWQEYEEYYGSLVRWMVQVEAALSTDPEPKSQLVEKKTQLDNYRLILTDVENHERLVNELNESVANLEALSSNPEVADSLHDVRNRYDRLRNTANDIVDMLERSYDEHMDYHEAQQDCEKWLLQTSFKLMSHNTLNVSTMELTQRQIDKHRSLLREIEEYQGTLEQVTDKGRGLMENNPRVPQLSQQIEAQVQNLEESYRNLQATGVQIKNRLGDILKKWEEYRSLLESTDQYLGEDFPDWLESANEDVPDDLQDAYRQLEATKTMYEKLNSMKQELSNAAHRCESLSGTETTDQSAEEESAIASLAEQVNESMDDSIGQVETRMAKLRDIIHQWESVERQQTELRNWLHYKQEEVQELEEKPSKLHAEAAELEISRIKALRDDVQAKGPTVEGFVDRYRTLTQHNPSLADPVIRAVQEDWEELLGQVDNLIAVKERALQHSRDYPEHKAEMDDDLDRLARELERIDQMEATMADKGLMAVKIGDEAEKQLSSLDELRTKASKLTPTLSKHDQDLVEDQLRGVEKRISEIQGLSDKKRRAYQVLGTDLDEIRAEIEQYGAWLRERDEDLSKDLQLGHSVEDVENRIQQHQKMCEDLRGRQAVLDSITQKLGSLTSDLSKQEQQRVEEMVRSVQNDHQRVTHKADERRKWLDHCLSTRENLYVNLDKTHQWLQEKEKAAEKLQVVRLHSTDIEKQIEKSKTLLKEIQMYEPTVKQVETQCGEMQASSDHDSASYLSETLHGITSRYESLKSGTQAHIGKLKDSVGSRKLLETDLMKVELWCREAEVKISGELQLDSSLEVLEDQHRQHMVELCQTIGNEAKVFESLIADIGTRSEGFLSTLDSTDKLSFQQQIKSLREKHFQIATSVGERRQALESSLTTRTQISHSIQDAESWLSIAQEDMKRLNRPVGHSVEEARQALGEYETLQEKLASYRPSVAELSQSVETLRSSGHVTDAEDILRIISQHEMLMDQSEQYATRCKQALVIRQQFTDQQHQVGTTLRDCHDQLNEIRQSSIPVTTKLTRFKMILNQLQTLEPQIMVLGDKAQQIGVEATKGDNQALTAQVETLHSTLNELRSVIDEDTQDCERVQLEREDFEADVEQAILWMEERCETVAMKVPLDLDTDKVDLALHRHKVLSEELLATLEDMKAKAESEKTRFEEGGEALPQSLRDKLNELNHTEEKIKSAVVEKEQYLMGAKTDRLQFETSLRQVTEWLHGAEDLLEAGQGGLEYDTIYQQLEEHKEYFLEGSLCQDEMEQILELSERLLPTLDQNDQETLQQSLSNINLKVDGVVQAAQKRQDLLETKTAEWREYDLASQKVADVLEQLEERWASVTATVVRGPDDANQQLKHTQEFLVLLEQHRAAVDDLNDKTRDLDRFASAGSHNSISQTVGNVNERWNDLVSLVESKQVSLQDLDKDFECYKEIVSSLQRHLSEVNLQVQELRTQEMAGPELNSCLDDVKSQCDKLDVIQPQIATLKKQAQSLQRKLPGAEAKVHVQERMMELIEHYEKVNDKVKDAQQTIQEEKDERETFHTEVEQTVAWLKETKAQLSTLRPGKDTAEMHEKLEKQKLMEQEIAIRMEQMRRLTTSQEAKYTAQGAELPHEMRQYMVTMETLQTEVGGAMKEKEEELLHLREDRQEFENLHRLVSTWLEEGTMQLSEPIRDVDQSVQKHEELLSEFDAFKDKLASLKEVGREIHHHTSDPAEKEAIQKAFTDVSRHWSKLQRQAKEKTEELRKASEAKRNVDDKLSNIKLWAEKTERLIDTDLKVTSYQDVKQKLEDHKNSAKEGEQLQVKLEELSSSLKELDKLCDASPVMENVGDLTQRIFLIQTQLADRLHLLEEANTEVQHYERDVAELSHWMDQTRAHLMVKDAGVPLKDQLTFQDQLVEDIERQKVRAQAVLEHPPESLGLTRVNPVDSAKISMQIEHLLQHATEQSEQIHDAVHQQEQYDTDIHQLTVAIEDAQRQLKESPVVVANVDVLKQQMTEHTSVTSASEPNLLAISGRAPTSLSGPRRSSLNTKRSSLLGQELTRETKLTELNLSWNTLQQHLGAKEKELQAALEKQKKYQEAVKLVTANLEHVQSTLSAPLPVNIEQLPGQMEEHKATLQDLHTAREDIARVRERGRQIMEVSDPEGFKAMQATLTMLNDRVKGLETAADDRGKQLHSTVKNREKHNIALEAYRKRVNELEGWLTQARLQHAGTAIPCETSDTLRSQLEENKNLQNELNSRLQQLSDLAVQCDSLCEMESPVNADKLRRELADIQNSLGDFKLEALENQSHLKSALKESEKRQKEMDEYEGNVKKLQQWISDTRSLTMAPVSAAVVAQISAEQEQLHQLESDLSEHRQLLRSLSTSGLKVKEYRTATEGQEGRELPPVSEAELQLKWEALSKDLEHKKFSTQDTMQQEFLSSRPHITESRSLLLVPPTHPTLTKLADIHRILRDLNDCWRHLQTEIKDKELRLDQALDFQQRFQDALLSISVWLDSVEHKLLSSDHDKSTEQKLRETENLLKEIKSLQQEMLTVNKVSQQLLASGVGNKDIISQSLKDLGERVRTLESRAYRREAEIARTQTRWEDFRTETLGFRTQLDEMRNEFDDLRSAPSLPDRLSRNQKLEMQLSRCERTLESLQQRGLALSNVNPRMSLTAELRILHSSIHELRRRVHDNREDLRKFVAIQEQYGKIIQDYSEFLETAQDKLKTEVISAKDLGHLKQQCSAHKEFFGDLDEHRTMLETLAMQCDKETKEKYQPQQQGLNNLTQIVQDKASLHNQRLDRLVRQWTDLDRKVLVLQDFIADVERDLPSPVSDDDSLQTVQEKLATYQTLHNALNDHKPLVHEIVEKGKQILHSVNCPQLETTITDLADKFVELHSNVSIELKRTETLGDQWQTFEAESAVLKSWLMAANVQLSALKQLTDKDLQSIGAIRSKVDRILEFRKEVDSHLPLKNKVATIGQQLVKSKKYDTGNLDDRLTSFDEQWGQLLHDIDKAEAYLHQAQMDLMPSRQALHELGIWLDGIEKALREDKDRAVKSLGDIEAMLKKYKGYKIDLGSKQLTVDFVNQTILQSSQESIGQPSEKTEFAEKLGQLNKRWQIVNSDVADRLKNLETLHARWEEYEKGIKQLQDWFHTQEDRVKKYQLIGSEVNVRQTLRDCKALQDALKTKEEQIESTQRLGMSLAQMSKDSPGTVKGITDAVESVSSQWAGLNHQVGELQTVLEDVLGQWAEYHTELNTLNHVLNETDYTLTRYTAVSPDVHTLRVQLAKLQNLQSWFEKHLPQQEKFTKLSSQLMQVCDAPVRQDLQQTISDLKLRWNNLSAELRARCDKFDVCLQQWQRYKDEHERICGWVQERETQYNHLVLMRDSPNQRQQCLDQSKMLQLEMDNFQSQLNSLGRLGEEFTENLNTPLSGPISSQQAILGQRLVHLRQAVNKHRRAIEDDLTDHNEFEELLNTIDSFLKQSEKILGQRDPDKTSDNDLVKQRLDQFKDLSSQFANNQSQLDAVNDLGYRMALSEAYSEKLLQLNHRWQRMQTDTVDRYRKMQALLLLQQDFSQKCENWMSFLQQTEADLTRDVAGNYSDLMEQQKKCELFQAEVYSRQQILQSIIADGQKMLREGGVTDRQEFQRKLAMLADQWQNVIKQSNHRKSIIDKAALQWQTFRALLDRINSWLRNKDHDLQAYDFENASLQNVKYLLEKARGTLQEFTTQEENYTKIHEVGKELLQRADPQAEHEIRESLTSMQQQWHQIFGRFDGQRERLEGILRQWQLCEEELEDILSWLRELRKVLSAELPNSYDELQKDLHQCKDIETSFDNSEDRRQMLLAKERQLNTSVEATDLSVLKERIRLLSKQWDELRNQAALRRHRIFDKLHEWSGFNEKYRDMCDWIEQMEIKISSRTEYHVEDLLTKLQKDYRFEMDTKEKAKTELVHHGRELMSASSEVRASDIDQKISRLEDKWQHLKAVIAYRQHKLQETLLAVQQLEISMANLRRWLGDMEHELGTPVIYHECDFREIQRKLQHQQELQKDVEKHSPGIASVLNLCEVLLRDADACPTEVEYAALQQASRTLDKRWRNICQLAADRRFKIDETWQMWQRFNGEHKKFTDWLRDVQLQLREPRTGHSDVSVIKADIQHFETVQRKVRENLSQLETINKQYRKMAREGRTDNAGTLKDMMQDANDQWDSVSQRVTDAIRRLKQPSGIREDFETTRTTILTWWTQCSTKLLELENNTEMDVYTKIVEMKKIETEIEQYRKRIEYLNETALYLIEKGEPAEAVNVQDQLDEFRRHQRDVLQKVHTYQVKLQKISAGQMKTIAKPGRESEQTTSTDLEISEAFSLREKHKASWHTTTTTTRREDTMDWEMDDVEKYLESSPPDSPPEKRRATARVSPRPGSRHRKGEITETSSRLSREERRRRLREEVEERGQLARVDSLIEKLVESLEDAAEKIVMTEQELRSQTPTGPDSDYAPTDYAGLVRECELSINAVHNYERQLKREAGVSSMPSVDAQVNSVVERWEMLQARAVEKDLHLKQHRNDWAQFKVDLNNMLMWLDESEAFLENESYISDEITLLESVVRRHKDFLLQLESKKKVVMSINLIGKNFVYNKSDDSRHVREQLRQMNKRWEAVCSQANLLHHRLEVGLAHSEEFHHMIHDLLLWLESVENKLQQIEPVSLSAEDIVLRTQYRKLTELKDDMEHHQPEVLTLKETADQLLMTTDSPDMALARDKTRIIANRLKSLMRRCLTYVTQLENVLGLSTRSGSSSYDYTDSRYSRDSGIGMAVAPSPRLRTLESPSASYRTRPRSALAYTRQLLFGESRTLGGQPLDGETRSTTLAEGGTELGVVRQRRPALLARVIRAALPLQMLMLLLLGIACLVPVCEDEEYGCIFMNNLERSWTPMLRYTDGPPPT